MRIIDVFLNEGYKILYRVALGIMKFKEKELLKCERIDQIMLCLRDFKKPIWSDVDKFMSVILSIKLSRKDIKVFKIYF